MSDIERMIWRQRTGCDWKGGGGRRMSVDTTFQDMKRRVRNEGKCQMRFLNAKPGCWPYGELLFVCNADELTATFGDLTIPLETANEVAQLVALADGQHNRFTQDLEWGWEANQ